MPGSPARLGNVRADVEVIQGLLTGLVLQQAVKLELG